MVKTNPGHWESITPEAARNGDRIDFLDAETAETLAISHAFEGGIATLQLARDRLVGCSSWPLRFAVYSSGGNSCRSNPW